jgi:hypothetical protein
MMSRRISAQVGGRPATECVRGGERWPIVLAAQHSELVTQDDDLDVFGAPEPDGETGQRREETVQDAIRTPQHRRVSALARPVRYAARVFLVGGGAAMGPHATREDADRGSSTTPPAGVDYILASASMTGSSVPSKECP